MNPLHAIDFYKADHRNQYPQGTEYVYSNGTPRSNRLSNTGADKLVFFSLQAAMMKFLIKDFNEGFFNLPKAEVLRKYQRRMDNALGQGAITVEHIEALHDLQYLPIHIKALPEGSQVPMGVPVFTVINTVPAFFWLTNYLESVLSNMIWKGSTSATTAFEYKKLLTKYARMTGSPEELIQFQAHDFSFRGMSGLEDAMMSGMAHLTSFTGTDTVLAIDGLEDYYEGNSDIELLGCSVPATEHSVMCMGGLEDEIGTFSRLLDTYPVGIVSIVSDTWDFWKVLTEYAPALKEQILARTPVFAPDGTVIAPGKTVFRPDSGDPVKILTGYTEDEIIHLGGVAYERTDYPDEHGKELSEAEIKGAVEVLWDEFGGTETSKGYKLLNEHVGLIYGDSITLSRATQIMERLEAKGFASMNTVLGIGSYTYEYVTRDTYGFAMKATWGVVNGEQREIFKDPITDSGEKKSAKGLLRVIKENGEFKLLDQQTKAQEARGELKSVFLDGELMNTCSIRKIRERLEV